jgi:hypothetical protein
MFYWGLVDGWEGNEGEENTRTICGRRDENNSSHADKGKTNFDVNSHIWDSLGGIGPLWISVKLHCPLRILPLAAPCKLLPTAVQHQSAAIHTGVALRCELRENNATSQLYDPNFIAHRSPPPFLVISGRSCSQE